MKKANVSITQFILLILFLFLLAILVIYLAGPGNEIFNKLKLLLPSFNFTSEKPEKIGIIGYNLKQEIPKYYDGTAWQEFANKKKFDKKEISPEKLNYYFGENYYYNSKLRKSEKIPLNFDGAKFSQEFDIGPRYYCIFPYSIIRSGDSTRGDIKLAQVMLLGKSCKGEDYGTFTLKANENLEYEKKGEVQPKDITEQYPALYQEIKEKVIAWRDSVLEKPMYFEYDNDNNKGNGYYFCVKKTQLKDAPLLVIDLAKPVTQEQKCSQN